MAESKYDVLLRGGNPYQTPQERESNFLLKDNLIKVVETPPEKAAKQLTLAEQLGYPYQFVKDQDADELEKERIVGKFKYDEIIKKTPGLAEWLKDEKNAAIAYDDADNLSMIERTLKDPLRDLRRTPYGLIQGLGGMYQSAISATAFAAGGIPAAYDKIASLISGKETSAAYDWWRKNEIEPHMKRRQAFQLEKDYGTAEWIAHSIGSLAGLVSMAGLTGGVGQTAAAPAATATTSTVAMEAIKTGAMGMSIPAFSLGINTAFDVYEKTGDVSHAISAGMGDWFTMTAMGVVPLSMPGGVAKRMFMGGSSNLALDYLAQGYMNTLLPQEMLRQMKPEDAILSVAAGAALGGVLGPRLESSFRHIYEESAKNQIAKRNYETLQEVSTLMGESKVFGRSEKAMEAFHQKVSETGVKDLIIPRAEVEAVLESIGFEGTRELRKSYPKLSKLMEDGQARGEVVIPVKDFFTKLATQPIGEQLLPHVKADPDGRSLSEAEAFDLNAELRKEAEKIVEVSKTEREWGESYKKVYDQHLGQLDIAGHHTPDVRKGQAELTARYYEALATRMKIKPDEAYEKFPLKVFEGGLDSQLPSLEQAKSEGYQGENLGEAAEWVRAKEKGLDMSTEGRIIRAKEQGYNVKEIYTHDGGDFESIKKQGLFDGVFALAESEKFETAKTSGITNFVFRRPIARHGDVDFDYDLAIKTLKQEYPGKSDEFYDELYDWTAADKSNPWENNILDEFGYSDPGDASWEAQRLRGRIAVEQGYDAVSMSDEHGTSYLIPAGSKARSTNAAFDPDFVDSPNLLAQSDRGAYVPETQTIHLLENANLTTYIHESGHFFLDTHGKIASMSDAPAQVKQDMDTLIKWFGVDSLDTWNRMSLDEQRPYHEKFARGFERYMFEGKAPSLELRGLFRRFRAWMINTYKSVRALDVELTDEVRGVMDRMIATDDAIRAMVESNNYKPLYESKPPQMSNEDWESYQRNDFTEKARDDLNKRSVANMKWLDNAKSKALKALQKKAAVKRAAVKQEVTEEVLSRPIYQAREFLQNGTLEDAPRNKRQRELIQLAGLEGEKLSLEALKEMYGTDPNSIYRYVPKNLTTSKGGMDPDHVAEIFGIESGDKLVRDLIEAPTTKEMISQLTDRRMLERHGDLTDPVALERGAEEAIHNDMRIRVLIAEHAALNTAMGSKTEFKKQVNQYADDYLATQKVSEISYKRFTAQEAKASRLSEQAFKKGKLEEAAEYKRQQIINNVLAKKALEAQASVDKRVLKLKRLATNKNTRKQLRGDFLEQMDAFLARFDLRKAVPKAQRDEQMALREWIAEESKKNAAVAPEIDDAWLDSAYRKHYKDMTLEEFDGMYDAVEQLRHLARREEKMYQAVRQQTFEQEKGGILEELKEVAPEQFDKDGKPLGYNEKYKRTIKKRLKESLDKKDANYLNMENLVQILTDGRFGRFHESIVQRLSDAADRKVTMTKDLGKYLKPYIDAYTFKEKGAFGKRAIRIDEIDDSLTREQMVTIGLYYGSPEGRQRLNDGHNWSDQQIHAILSHLTKKDLDLMNAMWKMSDEMIWPELEALNKRTAGTAPPKVEAMSYDLKVGKARGGYTPIVYDADYNVPRMEKYDLGSSVESLLGGNLYGAKTKQGTSKQRKKNVNQRLAIDFSAMNIKIAESIHDIAFREAVADTYRLLNDKDIGAAVKGMVGPEVAKEMRLKVREAAAAPFAPQSSAERLWGAIRRNALMTIMGFSVKTAMINVTGLIPAVTRVSPIALGREFSKFPIFNKEGRDFVFERSEYMKNRSDNFDRDMQEAVRQISMKRKLGPDMQMAMGMIAYMDRAVALPVWRAAYGEALNGKINEIKMGDKDAAVKYADHIVRQTQGSGRGVDLAKVQTGSEAWKIWTMFYSYFNAQLGIIARSGHINISKDPKKLMKLAADFFNVMILPAVVSALLYGRIDDEEIAKSTGTEIALYGIGFLNPMLRDAATFTYNQFDEDRAFFGYRGSPAIGALEAVAKGVKSTYDIATGEGDKQDVKGAVMAGSYLTGAPGLQIWRTFNHLENVHSGESDFNPWYMFMGEPAKK